MSAPPKRWFRAVQEDLGAVSDALEWYLAELERAHKSIDISGTLLRANQSQPGYVAYYDSMHTDLDAILEYIQQRHRIARATALRRLAENPPTDIKLSAADIKLLAETDPDVVLLDEIMSEVRYVYKQFSSLLKALDQRGYTLNNITKIRIAGMEEVVV